MHDDAVVSQALKDIKPIVMPTTMPSDLIRTVSRNRVEMAREMKAELLLPNTKVVDALIDQKIMPMLRQVDSVQAPVFYLLASRPMLTEAMEEGWTDPRYQYIRFAHQVVYTPDVQMSVEHRLDDLVIWVPVDDQSSDDDKSRKLAEKIREFEVGLARSKGGLAQVGIHNLLEDFLFTNLVDIIKFPRMMRWFGAALADAYAVKYMAILTGDSRSSLMTELINGSPANPLQSQPLDLMNPMDPDDMYADRRILYVDAVRHKAAGAVGAWLAKGGDGVLAKTLPALRANPPANSQDLVQLIQKTTGIDLTPVLSPNFSDEMPKL